MKRRLVGTILLTVFLILSASGIYMMLMPFHKNIAVVHVIFSLMLISIASIHIINNRINLLKYLSIKNESIIKNILLYSLLIIVLFIGYIAVNDSKYTEAFYDKIYEIKLKKAGTESKKIIFDRYSIEKKLEPFQIQIEAKKGAFFGEPLFAVWLEDSIGKYVETIYISKSIASSVFENGKQVQNKWMPGILRRRESLPYWSHKRNIKEADGLYMPLEKNKDLDAVSGATPRRSFCLESPIDIQIDKKYKILLEVNQSFDWNEYYTKNLYPEDSVYSGSGLVGQPSLIYTNEFSIGENNIHKEFLNLTGHGHYSGANGNLYHNLDSITTAKEILDWIIFSIQPSPKK